MKLALEALQRLTFLPATISEAWLSRPVQPRVELGKLKNSLDTILARIDKGQARPSQSALDAARAQWQMFGGAAGRLDRRAKRVLCADRETAPTSAFLLAMEADNELPGRKRWIENLMAVYFLGWRDLPDPPLFESLLRRLVANFGGKSKWISECRPIANDLFSRQAPGTIAKAALAIKQDPQERLQSLLIPITAQLAEEVENAAIELWAAQFNANSRGFSAADAMTEVRYFRHCLASNSRLSRDSFGKAVSAAVLWEGTLQHEEFQRELLDFILSDSRLGDPRLPSNSPNWSVCHPEARQRVIALRARSDLAFFFDFVIQDNRDPHGRKRFWMRYIDQVEDSQVALSRNDLNRLRARVSENLSYATIAGSADVSAFLMKFRGSDAVFVEFSRSGNAAKVHDYSRFTEQIRGGLRARRFAITATTIPGGLKSVSSALASYSHVNGWQADVRRELAKHGVRLS